MSWNEPQPAFYVEPHASALKKLFAAALMRQPDNSFAAAREVEPHPGKAAWIATNWIDDPFVQDERARLLAVLGPIAKVPTKEEFAAEVYKKAAKLKDGSTEQLKFYEMFAKVMNYIEKDTMTIKHKGDPNNPIELRHTARGLTDDELARIATSSS